MKFRLVIAADDFQSAWNQLRQSVDNTERGHDKINSFTPTAFGAFADLELDECAASNLINTIKNQHQVDATLIDHNKIKEPFRLACFDMDSTLIKAECIVELASEFGVMAEVDRITEEAMAGHLDFRQSFERRLSMLKGLSQDKLSLVSERIEYSDGLSSMVTGLKSQGIKLAIFSGGFDFVALKLKREFGFDYVHTNQLEIKKGALTGGYIGELIDADSKKHLLSVYAKKLNIEAQHVIAVGDGANDIPMLKQAGLSFGYRPKKKVSEVVDMSLYQNGLDIIPAILNIK